MSKSRIDSLFKSAQAQGTLSPAATQALTVVDIGAEIEAAMGVNVDDVQSSEVVLLSLMPDDSGSIRFAGNAQVMRDGHNIVVEALQQTKQVDSILAMTRYLNGHVLYPYRSVKQAERMDSSNYDPNLGTPLFDQTIVLLGTVLAKSQEFLDAGIHCRTITLIITDSADLHSRSTAADVAKVVKDMLKSENHIIAAMGIDDGATDFRRVFSEMGIPDEWILTPQNTPHDIRQKCQTFSQSAVRASQNAASFSQTALAGFTN